MKAGDIYQERHSKELVEILEPNNPDWPSFPITCKGLLQISAKRSNKFQISKATFLVDFIKLPLSKRALVAYIALLF